LNTLKIIAIDRLTRSLKSRLDTTDQERVKEIEFLLRRLRVSSMEENPVIIKCRSYYNNWVMKMEITKQAVQLFEMSEMRRRIYWQLTQKAGVDAIEARLTYLNLILGIKQEKKDGK